MGLFPTDRQNKQFKSLVAHVWKGVIYLPVTYATNPITDTYKESFNNL